MGSTPNRKASVKKTVTKKNSSRNTVSKNNFQPNPAYVWIAVIVVAGLAIYGFLNKNTGESQAAKPQQVVYVSTSGSDNNTGEVPTKALRSLARAVQEAEAGELLRINIVGPSYTLVPAGGADKNKLELLDGSDVIVEPFYLNPQGGSKAPKVLINTNDRQKITIMSSSSTEAQNNRVQFYGFQLNKAGVQLIGRGQFSIYSNEFIEGGSAGNSWALDLHTKGNLKSQPAGADKLLVKDNQFYFVNRDNKWGSGYDPAIFLFPAGGDITIRSNTFKYPALSEYLPETMQSRALHVNGTSHAHSAVLDYNVFETKGYDGRRDVDRQIGIFGGQNIKSLRVYGNNIKMFSGQFRVS